MSSCFMKNLGTGSLSRNRWPSTTMSVQLMWLLMMRYQPSLRSRVSSSSCQSMRVVRRITRALQPSHSLMKPLLSRLQARPKAGMGNSNFPRETSRIRLAHRAVNNMVRPALMSSTRGPGSRLSMGVVYCVLSASS
ncbi:hypothetical protein D3C84_790080 [compost metagenome]